MQRNLPLVLMRPDQDAMPSRSPGRPIAAGHSAALQAPRSPGSANLRAKAASVPNRGGRGRAGIRSLKGCPSRG